MNSRPMLQCGRPFAPVERQEPSDRPLLHQACRTATLSGREWRFPLPFKLTMRWRLIGFPARKMHCRFARWPRGSSSGDSIKFRGQQTHLPCFFPGPDIPTRASRMSVRRGWTRWHERAPDSFDGKRSITPTDRHRSSYAWNRLKGSRATGRHQESAKRKPMEFDV